MFSKLFTVVAVTGIVLPVPQMADRLGRNDYAIQDKDPEFMKPLAGC